MQLTATSKLEQFILLRNAAQIKSLCILAGNQHGHFLIDQYRLSLSFNMVGLSNRN